jgi:hypothetical protein
MRIDPAPSPEKYVDDLFPKTDEAVQEAMVDMMSEWQFPQTFCAIDGSHIPIKFHPGVKRPTNNITTLRVSIL